MCCEDGPDGHTEQQHHDASACFDLACRFDHPHGGPFPLLDGTSRQVYLDDMTQTPTAEVAEGLAAIAKAAEDVTASDRALRWLVTMTKMQGATWQEIGDVLGVSRQAAQERFGRVVPR